MIERLSRSFEFRSSVPAAILASLLAHAAIWGALTHYATLPDLGIELVIPMDMQLGMDAPPAPPPPPVAPPPEPEPTPQPEAAAEPAPAPAPADAISTTPPKPRRRRRPRPEPVIEAAPVVNSFTLLPSALAAQATDLTAFAPPGAQIAMRVDFARVRGTELENDVRQLLGAVADWRALLEGSGIDAINDLERVLIATPDMRREHIVISGQFLGGRTKVEQAVSALAAARQVEAPWREENGFAVAPWPNDDPTPRVVTLVGDNEFTISQPGDLERILAVAQARRERETRKRAEEAAHAPVAAPAPEPAPNEGEPAAEGAVQEPAAPQGPVLLEMRPDEVIAIDIEGARNFLRGAGDLIPQSLSASAALRDDEGHKRFFIHIHAAYEDAEATARAITRWTEFRNAYAQHPLVALVGMSMPMRMAVFSQHDSAMEVDTDLGLAPARFILNYVRGWFTDGRPLPRAVRDQISPQGAAPSPAPAAPAPSPPPPPTEPSAPAAPSAE